MCGICGIVNSGDAKNIDIAELKAMSDSIRHRGPDSDGFYAVPPVGLGIIRLKVIDLAMGDQPICNETGTLWIVFNGEIYNYAELRADLIRKGHVFRTQSDTEVILHQYEEDGDHSVEKFRGMSAFAIWDSARRQVMLARDRFGIKPLFVAQHGDRLAFASEIKAQFPLSWIDRSWNATAHRSYLSLGYIPSPWTPYNGLRKFEQGTTEIWGNDGKGSVGLLSRRKYWKPTSTVNDPIPSFSVCHYCFHHDDSCAASR